MRHETEKHYARRLCGHTRDFAHGVNGPTAHESGDGLSVSERLVVLHDANACHRLMISRAVEKHDIARTNVFRRCMGEVREFDSVANGIRWQEKLQLLY